MVFTPKALYSIAQGQHAVACATLGDLDVRPMDVGVSWCVWVIGNPLGVRPMDGSVPWCVWVIGNPLGVRPMDGSVSWCVWVIGNPRVSPRVAHAIAC